MAPLKFEENYKEILEKRTIQPSDTSWEQLNAKLDKLQSQKKISKKDQWYRIAAIFIGVVLTSSIILNYNSVFKNENKIIVEGSPKTNINNKNIIVDNNTVKREKDKHNNWIKTPIFKEQDSIFLNEISTTKLINRKNLHTKSKNNISGITITTKREREEDVYKDKMVKNNKNSNAVILPIDSLQIKNKVAAIVTHIKELQKNKNQVTEEEINMLLRIAQQEITMERMLKSSTISALNLLNEVEEELDETFKQRVFEALKVGFQKVKIAVVKRDN